MEITDKVRDKAKQLRNREGIEGETTRAMEKATSLLPSSTWLVAAGASILGSITLKLLGRDTTANFVGQWAPTFLILGLYNKLVKVEGSDRSEA